MFVESAASKSSLSKRKYVYGVGVNDAWYITQYKSKEGKSLWCPFYVRWKGMLERCYSTKYKEKHTTYVGCTVSEGWLLFSNFRSWMEKQDWKGKQLDKDILVPDNKVYSESTCIFITRGLNTLLIGCDATRGDCPRGVSWSKNCSRYTSYCAVKGKLKYLGCFVTEREAEITYCIFKSNLIIDTSKEKEAAKQPKLQEGLLLHAQRFTDRASYLTDKGVN